MSNDFLLGCNYWASNAGTEMWNDWSEETVDGDFAKLAEYGIEYLRVFPNWRDFQPVYPLLDSGRGIRDYRLHDADVPENPYYIDTVMAERFGIMCDLAEKHGLKLIVAILTGGMSGRAFMPPVLYGKRAIADPTALMFQQKFVTGMVKMFKDKPSIYAWDLGNECNYFLAANGRDEALNWTMMICNAIKASDTTRPIISGMCGLGVGGAWRIEDQADNTDVLTTHPYPFWVQHCSEGRISSIQTLLHATCETKYYSDIGQKPCLVEEIGTMGPMICDNKTSADFMRLNLYSNWANGATGVMWWCANEQIDLKMPPYEYQMCEVELGMFDRDGNAKPVLEEVKRFSKLLDGFDFELPPLKEDAVCLATAGQDQWGIMYSSYVLAKQAGVNLRFADATKDIPDAEIYLMPSITGVYVMPSYNYDKLKQKVYDGATLYISNERGILSDFNALTGLTVNDSMTKFESGTFALNGAEIPYARDRHYIAKTDRAECLAEDKNGLPLFTKCKYGKGTVYYLNFPLERNTVSVSDAFDGSRYEVYNEIFKEAKEKFAVGYDNKYIGMTRHGDDEYVTLINYSPKSRKPLLTVKSGYALDVLYGNIEELPPYEMAVIKLKKQ